MELRHALIINLTVSFTMKQPQTLTVHLAQPGHMLFAPDLLKNPDEEEKHEGVKLNRAASPSDSPRAAPVHCVFNFENCEPEEDESARIPRWHMRRSPIYDQAFKMAREMITNI